MSQHLPVDAQQVHLDGGVDHHDLLGQRRHPAPIGVSGAIDHAPFQVRHHVTCQVQVQALGGFQGGLGAVVVHEHEHHQAQQCQHPAGDGGRLQVQRPLGVACAQGKTSNR